MKENAPNWLSTALTTIGSGLIVILLVWIASSQVSIGLAQAVSATKQDHIITELAENTSRMNSDVERLDKLLARIWPRLRTHGENVTILKRELERVCECKLELKTPEKM